MAKQLICLDTSILIDYFRKTNKSNSQLVKLSQNYEFAISVITKLELLYAATDEQNIFWTNILRKISVLALTEPEIEIAIKTMKKLRKNNKMIELPDILIASTAMANGLQIGTLNKKHFERIEGLAIIDSL